MPEGAGLGHLSASPCYAIAMEDRHHRRKAHRRSPSRPKSTGRLPESELPLQDDERWLQDSDCYLSKSSLRLDQLFRTPNSGPSWRLLKTDWSEWAARNRPQQSYTCSKCGSRNDLYIETQDKELEDCHEICPDEEGPDFALLIDPQRLCHRSRTTGYLSAGKKVRVCSFPFPPRGPAQRLDLFWRDLYLRDYVKFHGHDAAINLEHIGRQPVVPDTWNVRPMQSVWALLPTPGPYDGTDVWAIRIHNLQQDNPRANAIDPVEIAAAFHNLPLSGQERLSRTIFVPVELDRGIAEQLDLVPKLLEIQKHLYRFTGKRAPRDKSGNQWRDIYIFYLKETTHMKVKEIAQEVFPGQDEVSSMHQVKRIAGKVRKAVARAGIRLPARST